VVLMTHGQLAVVLEDHGLKVRCKPGRDVFKFQCPGHPDGKNLSAVASIGRDGRQLVHCSSGCSIREIREALGLPFEAFDGWDTYRHKRLRTALSRSPITLSISAVEILDANRLLKKHSDGEIEQVAVELPLPPRAGRATRLVAADMELLFGLADAADVGHVPLMYGMYWAGPRLGVNPSSVAYALRALVQHGAIVRAKNVPAWNGRVTRTYRRAGR
jgi:hypothetical protein